MGTERATELPDIYHQTVYRYVLFMIIIILMIIIREFRLADIQQIIEKMLGRNQKSDWSVDFLEDREELTGTC